MRFLTETGYVVSRVSQSVLLTPHFFDSNFTTDGVFSEQQCLVSAKSWAQSNGSGPILVEMVFTSSD